MSKSKRNNPVAVVTGATGYIGISICKKLTQQGFSIAAVYNNNISSMNDLIASIDDIGGECFPYQYDLSHVDGLSVLVSKIITDLGQIDVFVHCAGVMCREFLMLSKSSPSDIQKIMAVNWFSAVEIVRSCGKSMSRRGWGRIIFIGSKAGECAIPGQSVYSSSKAALHSSAISLSNEMGRFGITVNVVAPGALDDNSDIYEESDRVKVEKMIGLRRLGKNHEISNVVSFLCSDNASYINGAVISVDGGARF